MQNVATSRRNLLLACSGLELQGGGRTLLARLLASACASYAETHGLSFSILSLGKPEADYDPPAPTWFASGRRLAFIRRLLTAQARSPRPALVFDLLGPCRVQSLLPRPFRSPYLLTLLGIEIWRPLRHSERVALSGATRRLAISEATLRGGAPYLPVEVSECDVLHLALEEDRSPAGTADRALLQTVGEGFLLIVGRMAREEAYKGHDVLLEALARLAESEMEPRLVIAGGGDDRRRLEQLARDLHVDHHVTFTGHVSEATLAELYDRCALFVMPSRGEGFGLVYLEAMRAAKPCVAVRGTAAEEIVIDGVTGRLVDGEDAAELAGVLEDLVPSPEARRSLGEAGHRRFRQHFSYVQFETGLHEHLDGLTVEAG